MKLGFLVFVLSSVQLLWAQDVPVHLRNFGKVDAHVYRGGEPGNAGLKELAAMHVVLDIDLRESGNATEHEKTAAQSLGMTYMNVPLPQFGAPPEESVKKVLLMLQGNHDGPVFVHCRRGKDRTGTIIACYRIQEDHWSNEVAQREANQYGMSLAERGMRHFIQNFKPIFLGDALATTH